MAVKDLIAPSQTQIKKQDSLWGTAEKMLKNKPVSPNSTGGYGPRQENVTGLENPTKRGVNNPNATPVKKPVNNSPTYMAAETMVKNNPVVGSNGHIGVRKALTDMGYDNNKIGYNSSAGNVTYDGHDIIKPGRVENGTSYATESDILAAAQIIAANGGSQPVKVADYLQGANVPVAWNDETQQLTIGGVPYNAATFGDRAYMSEPVLKAAIDMYYKNTGIQKETDIANEYIGKNDETAQRYRELAAKEFNYNPNTDPGTVALRKAYERMAQRAMRDVAGQYGTMNGGLLTSGGLEAIASARADYDNQFLAQIPTLQQAAYDRFMSESQRQQGLYGEAANLDTQSYGIEEAANRNTINDAAMTYEREQERLLLKRTQDAEDIANIFNNGKLRGFFTTEEALRIGVPVGTSPYAAEVEQKRMLNDEDLRVYQKQLEMSNQAQLDLTGAMIAKGYKSTGRRSSGGGGDDYVGTVNLKTYTKNRDAFIKNFNNYYKPDSKGTGSSAADKYMADVGLADSNNRDPIYADASGNYHVSKDYEQYLYESLQNNKNMSDAEKNYFINEVGLYPLVLNLRGD